MNSKGEWMVGPLVATLATVFFLCQKIAIWKPSQATDNEVYMVK